MDGKKKQISVRAFMKSFVCRSSSGPDQEVPAKKSCCDEEKPVKKSRRDGEVPAKRSRRGVDIPAMKSRGVEVSVKKCRGDEEESVDSRLPSDGEEKTFSLWKQGLHARSLSNHARVSNFLLHVRVKRRRDHFRLRGLEKFLGYTTMLKLTLHFASPVWLHWQGSKYYLIILTQPSSRRDIGTGNTH